MQHLNKAFVFLSLFSASLAFSEQASDQITLESSVSFEWMPDSLSQPNISVNFVGDNTIDLSLFNWECKASAFDLRSRCQSQAPEPSRYTLKSDIDMSEDPNYRYFRFLLIDEGGKAHPDKSLRLVVKASNTARLQDVVSLVNINEDGVVVKQKDLVKNVNASFRVRSKDARQPQ